MGNSLSDSDDEGKVEAPIDADDEVSDGDDASESETRPTTDLCHLFSDNATLRATATKVKEKIPENVILQHNSHIMQWLEARLERMDDSITLAQFCDMLMNQGVERCEALKAFHQFDCDGSGVADVQTMIEAMSQFSSRSALGELGKSIRILQSCSLTPGFVDVYAGTTHHVDKHGARILKYLLRNRAESTSLPFPYLNSFNNVYIMRSSVLKSLLNATKEEVKDFEVESELSEVEKRTIYNCISNIEVSSNHSEAHLLRSNSTFWQSDGAARSHWIRLHIKNNIMLKHLSIGVVSTDQSYMPELVTISVGQSPNKLREIKEIKIENHITGRVLLLKNMKVHYAYIQINIKRCHGDGCDTRIHGVRAVGFKLVKEQGVTTVLDASALWYLQVLTTTISLNLPQSPALRTTLLAHTKKSLESMPPLILSSSSTEKPAFLSRSVLQEIENFAEKLAQSPDSPDQLTVEGLQVILALNLARGSVAGLVRFLNKIVEIPSLKLPCVDLLAKAVAARNSCWEKLGAYIPVTYLASDGGSGSSNVGPDAVVESRPASNTRSQVSINTRVYLTENGKTKCTMIFKAEENIQLTKVRIQVASGNKGPKYGLIFVYNPESVSELSPKFDAEEHINYFSKYDFWREKEFEFSISYRNAGLGGLADNPVCFFQVDNDCDEVDAPVLWNAVGKYILVKFLEPRHESATKLGIVSIKFYGLTKNLILDTKSLKSVAVPDPSKRQICEIPEVVSVVSTFTTDIATEQVKKRGRVVKPQFEFLDLSDLDVSQLWNLYTVCEKRMFEETGGGKNYDHWNRSSLLVLQLIHGLIPVLATSRGTSESSRDSLFQRLCNIVNSETVTGSDPSSIHTQNKLRLMKQIIIDGAPLFFPEKSKKRVELFKLLKSVTDQSSMPSMSLVFQSLCQFFSSVDPKGLLELPNNPTDDFSSSGTLDMMKNLLMVAGQEIQDMTTEKVGPSLTGPEGQEKVGPEVPDIKQAEPEPAQEVESPTVLPQSDVVKQSAGLQQSDVVQKSDEVEQGATAVSKPPIIETPRAEARASDENAKSPSTKLEEALQNINVSAKEVQDILNDIKDSELEAKATFQQIQQSAERANELFKQARESLADIGNSIKGNMALFDSNPSSSDDVAGHLKTATSAGEKAENGHQMTYLVRLTASLQTSLLMWCWQQLDTKSTLENEKFVILINDIVKNYTCNVAEKAIEFFDVFKVLTAEQLKLKTDAEQPFFLSIILRQLMLLLTTLVDKLNTQTKVKILENFKKLAVAVSDIARANPELFCDISSDCWKEVDTEETVLRTWEVESPHDYLNHSNIVQTFHCPGASKLVVEFDPRCETERRYDYLEFTDAKGLKLRFDQKVGSTKWPKKVTFSGPYVGFLFHSDSSNTEWGYKFTVTAIGTPDIQNSWLTDLQLGLIKVLGQLAGSTLSSNPILPHENPLNSDTSELDILRSDLWTSLFRGGYCVGKLQRSLSGKFAANEHNKVCNFLLNLVAAAETKGQPASGVEEGFGKQAARFLSKCQEINKAKIGMTVGGSKVDSAIAALLAALIWHCQQLREDTEKFLNNGDQGEITEGISQAYITAESMRTGLALDRQKWNAQENKGDSDDPADVFVSKALYLLKFAGLTKVQLKNEMRTKYHKQLSMKKAGNKRPFVRNEILEKFPSFRLVMEFLQDHAWTAERVHLMLQERTRFASAVSDVYMFAAEILRILSNIDPFQIPVILFFREMFSYQDKFAKHYADGLDGCGLEQETKVRMAYYTLVRKFVEAFQQFQELQQDNKVMPAYDFLQCCLLHLLDVDWQPYDLSFVKELQLPQLFLNIAKECSVSLPTDTVKMRDLVATERDEEKEMEDYELSMKWYEEINRSDINEWFRQKESSKDDKKVVKMFVARFSDVLDVEISCDGCGVTLPGRRYRCLQCMDMDLCTTCFSGGVEPEDHRDNHDIVHLVFKCNHCQAFIVGTRIHCNQCDDFDLCLGCHVKKLFPPGHTVEHEFVSIPMVKLKTSQSSNSSLKAYIHQHVWLLYTSLTLTLSDIVYGVDNVFIDLDYMRIAGELQQQCIMQATACLNHVIAEGEVEAMKEMPLEKRREQTFAIHSQERIMGLLGAVMPHHEPRDNVTDAGFNFWTEDFLSQLLEVARGVQGHELNTKHLALRLMGRLLMNCDPKTCISQMADSSTQKLVGPNTAYKLAYPGQQTVAHLFNIGTKAFEKSGLEWACSVARMLEMLFNTPHWKSVIQQHIAQCVQNLKHGVHISYIFPMFVIAGFPEVLTTGTLVDYNCTSIETQSGVVLKHFPDKYQALIVDLKSRKRHTIRDELVTCHNEVADILEMDVVGKFVSFVIETVAKIRANETLSIETLWILSLSLKVLNRCFKSDKMITAGKKIFTSNFIQSLVYLACNGTGLNQNWLLKDLEVLTLICYTHDGSSIKKNKISNLKEKKKKTEQAAGADTKSDRTTEVLKVVEDDNKGPDDDEDDDEDDTLSETTDIDDTDDSDWQVKQSSDDDIDVNTQSEATTADSEWGSLNLDQHTKDLLEAIHTNLEIPYPVLRALYAMNEGKAEGIVKSIEENFGETNEAVNTILQKMQGAADVDKRESTANDETVVDTGITVHSSMGQTHKIPETAVSETGDNPQNLFKQQESLAGEIGERMRGKSSLLLKKELEKHGRSGSPEYFLKVNMAMCVLYARHTLTGLLAFWPESGPVINSSLLGCKDVKQIPCVLDLLYKIDTRNFFSKVVDKVIHMCDANSLVPIAYTAAKFMEEITLSAISRESSHNYTEKDKKKSHIQLPGALYLTITFDSRCATLDDDSLMFSTRREMDKDIHIFSGSANARWSSFHLPGDTLYYKFCIDDYDPDISNYWGYKFTVTPGTRDSFETGHAILNAVLSSSVAKSLPLGQLWSSLVYVACKQPGVQRLKAISLMLKIVSLQGKAVCGESKPAPDIDLALLKPLWELYKTMTRDDKEPVIQPAVVRALTDLFLHTENLASEWNMTENYLVALMDISAISPSIFQGLTNIAAISLEIGYENVASELLNCLQAALFDKKEKMT
ncbi:zinc finger ZZ-type and EF-hand domain-containing protein 1-like isoform X2 [Physella acuta]|uniref:zinc finger ZZ-type and EF-hand domain-containing protein 1-like isoform X2 n=1 Tax=Physella acuta TaxID=109671 RepID=UPI0027DBE496|nr:zinc finger ZZ-type and EF-hand domain-containing protein 1-like isoform X2 [Physella acuta]